MTRRLPVTLVAATGIAILLLHAGCGGDDPTDAPIPIIDGPDADASAEQPTGSRPDADASDASRPVSGGTLLVPGDVEIVGATDDGYVAYIRTNAARDRTLAVFDTKTHKSTPIAESKSSSDRALVRGTMVMLWAKTLAPYGWGGLTLWAAATGAHTAPGGSTTMLGGVATNADHTRLALSWGLPSAKGAVTNIAVSGPTFSPAPEILVPNIGARCPIQLEPAGERFVVVSCEESETAGTVRVIGASNDVTTVRADTRPFFSADQTGSRVFVIGTAGDAEVHTLPGNAVTPIATNVVSGRLTPDGETLFYTTTSGALHRVSSDDPTAGIELSASGAREILLVSPDQSRAVVAALPGDDANASSVRYDLALVSLTTPGAPLSLVATSTGVPIRFTRSGSHLLYLTDVPASGRKGAKLRARPIAGGPEVVVGTEVATLLEPQGSTRLVFTEEQPDYTRDLKVVDLEGDVAPKPVIDDVTTGTAIGDVAYVTIKQQGLYAIPLP
jgi:hypothetical protein